MTEQSAQPAPQPARPRVDTTAADLGSLAAMGVVEAPPEPSPESPAPSTQPFQEPVYEPPAG